jgi:Holliday junction resolvasome RuvABC ATP-dependent DNA helicase subunit
MDQSLVSYALQLPDILTLSQEMEVIDIDNLHAARKLVKRMLVQALKQDFLAVYELTEAKSSAYEFSAKVNKLTSLLSTHPRLLI